jgi:hypothetical protein
MGKTIRIVACLLVFAVAAAILLGVFALGGAFVGMG